jgi:hypothetical protein
LYNIQNYRLSELLQAYYCLIDGKHISLPVFWVARELIHKPASDPELRIRVDQIILSEKHQEEYERFIKAIVLFYIEKEQISYEQAETIIRQTVQIYADKTKEAITGGVNPRQINFLLKFRDKVKGKIKYIIIQKLNGYKLLKRVWYDRLYSGHYSPEKQILFRKARKCKGVPFFTKSGLKEIDRISKIIESYPI